MALQSWDGEPRVAYDALHALIVRMFTALGLTPEDAKIAADSLLIADVRGIETHGVQRMHFYVQGIRKGMVAPRAELTVDRERPGSIALNANHGLGLVQATKAMDRVIEKAKETGICMGTLRDVSHYGIAGRYALMAVEHDMCGMSMTNTSPLVVPLGGKRKALGTNPIAFAAPTTGDPFCLDMATSTVAVGKVEVAKRLGLQIPTGWGLIDGAPTNTPESVNGLTPLGGTLELGGHKGYGLGLMVEIICGQLASSPWSAEIGREHADGDSGRCGQWFMAWQVDAFRDVQDFKQAMTDMCLDLRAMEPIDPAAPVLIPGDPELMAARYNQEHGVPIRQAVFDELRADAESLGIAFL